MNHEFCLIYVVCESVEEAKSIGKKLIEKKLVACVNIVPSMISMYTWEGSLCDSQETVLLCKTSADKFSPVSERIQQLHSYETPCILEIPIGSINDAYRDWLKLQLS